jgi:5,10-methylenetetrahydromethanopterin reductase
MTLRGSCGVSFLGDLSVTSTVELAVRAEELGVAALWMSETYFERDAWTAMTAIAARTSRATVGTGVLPVFMRHPTLLAMSFATLDELSNGRAVAGIGTGVGNVVSGQLGYDYSSPLTAMREAITILRTLLGGQTADLDGRVFSARDVRLAGVPLTREIPIHVAAMGPRMAELAGELADGVHFAMPTISFVQEANRSVDAGAQRAGRDSGAIERVAWIIAAVHEDGDIARAVAKEHIAVAMATAVGEAAYAGAGLDVAIPGRLREALATGGLRAAVALVDDAQVDAFAAAGTANQVVEKVEAMFDAGVTHPVLTAYGPHAAQVLPVAARFPAGG